MLKVGTEAPSFTLPDKNGKSVSLSDFKGKKVVLYFYPKDNTSGCTKQACAYAAHNADFESKGAVVIGISKDSPKSHLGFAEKYGLPFVLLSDTETCVLQSYDVWKEKSMYGKKYFGVVRSTYIIDENGVIIGAYEKVKPESDAENMLKALGEL